MSIEVGIIVFLLINIVGFYLMGADKRKARKKQFRISERALWTIALFGGATGMTVGMNYFRHKTKHLSFKFGLPTVMLLQFLLLAFVMI